MIPRWSFPMSLSIPKRVTLCDFLDHVVTLHFSPCLVRVGNGSSLYFSRSQGLKQGTVGNTRTGRRSSLGVGVCEDGPKQRGFETWWKSACGLRKERRRPQSPSLPDFLKALYSILPYPLEILCILGRGIECLHRSRIWIEGLIFS